MCRYPYAITKNFVRSFPHGTQANDKICSLFGRRVPYVLREVPRNTEFEEIRHAKYIILGDRYLLENEGVDMMQRGGIKMMERVGDGKTDILD